MKILVIGGTRFLGRHIITLARAMRHELTLFNRNQTNPGLFRRIAETIQGNRETDLDKLDGTWDVVIDTCGYLPRIVRKSAEALKSKVGRYVFISSVSVYADFSKPGIDESYPVGKLAENTEEITGETYGPLKALCEQTVQEVYGPDATIIRPGLIVGPHDPTDRFTYWPVRIARGGDVLVPDRPGAMTQIIDARDVAYFINHLINVNVSGVFNVTGNPVTLNTIFETCKRISHSDAHFKWAPVEFLEKHHVEPWSDMPAWVPEAGENAGISQVSIKQALQAGLTFTPLSKTIQDIYEWETERLPGSPLKAGLNPEREKELLELLSHVQ